MTATQTNTRFLHNPSPPVHSWLGRRGGRPGQTLFILGPRLLLMAGLLLLWKGSEPLLRAQAEFQDAGVCSRCHVVSVLEWQISGHAQAGTGCQSCHGPSEAHVANERNEVKPDRVPRGESAARLCLSCHAAGCPETKQTSRCLSCHHNHTLTEPGRASAPPAAVESRAAQQLNRLARFQEKLEEGEALVAQQDWAGARRAFQEALDLQPGDPRPRARLRLVERRLDPELPGFDIAGEAYDAATGLAKEVKVTGLDIPMILIPPGEFDIGSDRLPESRPVHTVAVREFYLGKYELTQAEWTAVMGANPSTHQEMPDAGRMPVETISWLDAQEFVQRLNERVPGGGFRLPTEAEWEYAARASGSGWKPSDLARHAWFRENSALAPGAEPREFERVDRFAPRPAGAKQPNPWGLFDMQGNVWEWCSSLAKPYLYEAGDGRESLDAPGLRILRGGGYADSASFLDPAFRHGERPERRYRWNGMRLARSVPGE